jgi:hypothetical protein
MAPETRAPADCPFLTVAPQRRGPMALRIARLTPLRLIPQRQQHSSYR